MKYICTVNDREYIVTVDHEGQITVDDETFQVDFQQLAEGGVLSLLINNHSLEAIIEEREEAWEVLIRGELYSVKVQDERAYRLAKARGTTLAYMGEATVKSPMPGVIVSIPVEVGQHIQSGEKVIILESMKMENELRSPRNGTVKAVHVAPGATVEKDQVLVIIGDGDGGD
jgi:biotin carboxyl carrier protein